MLNRESKLPEMCPACGHVGERSLEEWEVVLPANKIRCRHCSKWFTMYRRCPECGVPVIMRATLLDQLFVPVSIIKTLTGKFRAVCPNCHKKVPVLDADIVAG